MGDDPNDLSDVIREEKSRGRRPIDTQAEREHQLLVKGYLKLLSERNKQKFLRAIRSLGLQDGSPEFQQAVQAWCEFWQRRTQSP